MALRGRRGRVFDGLGGPSYGQDQLDGPDARRFGFCHWSEVLAPLWRQFAAQVCQLGFLLGR